MNLDELHAAVCAAPDDDAPRIAYANFLAQYRPERTEFVRLQVARRADDRAHKRPNSVRTPRERQLIQQHGEEWARYMRVYLVPNPSVGGDLGCEFEGGFIAHARVAIENVVGLGERLYQMAPIQHLDVMRGDGPARRVLAAPGLDHLDSISLAELGLDNDDARALAECSALSRATWVDLSGNQIGRDGLIALARSPVFANKVRVLLDNNLCSAAERPYFDADGSVAGVGAEVSPEVIEQAAGHAVPWLRYPWGHRDRAPDRYYAKWFAPGGR